MATAADANTRHFRQVSNSWGRIAALALIYIAAWVALWWASGLSHLADRASLWYPPAGLTFAILLEHGARALPLPITASLIACLSLSFDSWEHWPHYLLAHLIPPLGYAAAAHILRSAPIGRQDEKWHFNDPQRAAIFLGVAAGGSLFAALIGMLALWIAGLQPAESSFPELALGWWASDFIGVVTVTPLALIFAAPLARQFRQGKLLHLPESWALADPPTTRLVLTQIALSALLLPALFWIPHRLWPDQPQSFLILLLPVLTWIAATHGMRGTALTVFLYELGIVAMAALFGRANQMLQYQIVMLAIMVSGLLTGAVSQARLAHHARLRAMAEVSNDLLWEFDARGRLRNVGGQFGKAIEWRKDYQNADWRMYVAPQEQDTDFSELETAIQQRRSFQQLALRLRLPGRELSVWTLNSGLPVFDEDGEFLGYRGATTDITDHKQVEALLRSFNQALEAKVAERTQTLAKASRRNWRLANFDSLTGLPNRNLFFEHMRKGLQQARRQWRLAALLLVDLDGFKEVNDTFGHDMGDELLRRIADRLQQCVRATDTVARLGGDEFTVILLDLEHPHGAETVARKIVERLAEPAPLGETSVTVTTSVGIALYRPEWPDSLDQAMKLLRQADAAMYAAKRAGKNRWRFAESPDLD